MTMMTIMVMMMMKDNVVTNNAGQACMFSYAWQVPISILTATISLNKITAMGSLNKTAWPWTSQREHVWCLQHSAVTCETGKEGLQVRGVLMFSLEWKC